MNEQDLKQIKEVVDKSLDEKLPKGFGQFWEDNLEPAFDSIHDSVQVVEAKVNKALNIELVRLEKRLKVVEGKLGIVPPVAN